MKANLIKYETINRKCRETKDRAKGKPTMINRMYISPRSLSSRARSDDMGSFVDLRQTQWHSETIYKSDWPGPEKGETKKSKLVSVDSSLKEHRFKYLS